METAGVEIGVPKRHQEEVGGGDQGHGQGGDQGHGQHHGDLFLLQQFILLHLLLISYICCHSKEPYAITPRSHLAICCHSKEPYAAIPRCHMSPL